MRLKQCGITMAMALGLASGVHASDATVTTANAQVSLVSQNSHVEPGKPAWIGLRIAHQPHWHTYWRNPGESGMPTSLRWNLPAGVTVGDIAWPLPQRIPTGGLVNYGYENEIVLPMQISVPSGQISPLQISAKASWLICKEVCIPEEGEVSLTLNVAEKPTEPNRYAALFTKALAAQPQTLKTGGPQAIRSADAITLRFDAPPAEKISSAYFYAYDEGVVEPSAPQTFARDGSAITLKLMPVANAATTQSIQGVLVVNDAQGFSVQAPLGTALASNAPAAPLAQGKPETLSGGADLTILAAFAFAFFGGMVLNLMPCVFPVLSIKILGFAQHAGDDKASMRMHGIAYSVGVVASFLALAGALLAVRAAGSNVGWGFQLQHPVVIGVLALVFFLIGLNLLGVFELRFAPQVEGGDHKNPMINAFLSGVLAVIAASPCTAPFMGAALGFALTQSAFTSLAIFAALGIGMALPYAVLAWFPGWLKKLPRPGNWMNTMKKWLSLPMFATVAWLGWVLWLQLAPVSEAQAHTAQTANDKWKVWDDAAIQTSLTQGKPVFVDFTAAWCVSCQANKKLVLNTDGVGAAFAQKNVTLMRADWTKQDPKITDALKALGRSGVPVYVLHRPGKSPLVLPEVLTSGIVDEALATL